MWIFLKHSCSYPYSIQNLLFSLSTGRNTGFILHSIPNTIRFYSALLILPNLGPGGIVWCVWCFNPSFNNWKRRVYIKPRFQAPLENGKLWCLGCIFLRDSNCWGDVVAVPWRIGRDSFYICIFTLSTSLTTCTSLTPIVISFTNSALYGEFKPSWDTQNYLRLPAVVSMIFVAWMPSQLRFLRFIRFPNPWDHQRPSLPISGVPPGMPEVRLALLTVEQHCLVPSYLHSFLTAPSLISPETQLTSHQIAEDFPDHCWTLFRTSFYWTFLMWLFCFLLSGYSCLIPHGALLREQIRVELFFFKEEKPVLQFPIFLLLEKLWAVAKIGVVGTLTWDWASPVPRSPVIPAQEQASPSRDTHCRC